ncbi:hypothetical protein [Tunturiibacter gelidiferens]
MGDDDERMFAGKVSVDEKSAKTIGRCLSPGNARGFLVHLHGVNSKR